MTRNTRFQKGFTFIEILLVMAILTVTSSIAIPEISKAMQTTKIESCRANRIIIRNTCLQELVGHEDDSYVEKREIIEGVLKEYEDASKLCPDGGKYYAIELDGTVSVFCSDDITVTGWTKGAKYNAGDTMIEKGFIFVCLKSHTSGSRSNTRNPTVKSNKGSWKVIGTLPEESDGGIKLYSSTVRYAEGVIVRYKDNLYVRTNYNLTGGQTPYASTNSKNSRYWLYYGPANTEGE